MLIFGMGLYGLFISNASADVPSESDRALSGSSMFGMFALKVTVGISNIKHFASSVGTFCSIYQAIFSTLLFAYIGLALMCHVFVASSEKSD